MSADVNATFNAPYEVSVGPGGLRMTTVGGLPRLHPLSSRRSPHSVHLTFREAEILELIANEGPPIAAIAKRLWISQNTVKRHIHTLLTKTKCHSQLQLGMWAWRRGFLWWDDGERRIAIVERAP